MHAIFMFTKSVMGIECQLRLKIFSSCVKCKNLIDSHRINEMASDLINCDFENL